MYRLFIKRVLDVLLSLIGLIVLSPLLFLAILLVFIGDHTPIFYTQNRIGKNGNVFKLYKLRTMKLDMEDLGYTSMEDDPRYFFGSKFLRILKIDELPQLLNIIVGDMSIVGPRPTVKEDFDKMCEEQRKRFIVRPGLSGLAQISGNTSLIWPKRIELDIEYTHNISFLNDTLIIFKTVYMWLTNRLDSNPPKTGEW